MRSSKPISISHTTARRTIPPRCAMPMHGRIGYTEPWSQVNQELSDHMMPIYFSQVASLLDLYRRDKTGQSADPCFFTWPLITIYCCNPLIRHNGGSRHHCHRADDEEAPRYQIDIRGLDFINHCRTYNAPLLR